MCETGERKGRKGGVNDGRQAKGAGHSDKEEQIYG